MNTNHARIMKNEYFFTFYFPYIVILFATASLANVYFLNEDGIILPSHDLNVFMLQLLMVIFIIWYSNTYDFKAIHGLFLKVVFILYGKWFIVAFYVFIFTILIISKKFARFKIPFCIELRIWPTLIYQMWYEYLSFHERWRSWGPCPT